MNIGFQASQIPKMTSVIVGIAIFVIYVISSVLLHHTDPFPNTSISGTACYYPQYLIFRIATISGGTILILSWFLNDFYVSLVAEQHNFAINKYQPKVVLLFGIMGSLFLMGSTANIDDGQRNQKWHLTCAKFFFIFTALACFYNTFIYSVLHFRGKCVKKASAYFKIGLFILSVILIYLSIVLDKLPINIGNIFEYSMTYVVLAYIYLIGKDVQKFYMVYELSE